MLVAAQVHMEGGGKAAHYMSAPPCFHVVLLILFLYHTPSCSPFPDNFGDSMGKPSLSKAALNSNQIFFNAELHDGDDLPAHIRYVWDCLLDFREAIFQDHKKNYEKDYELFLTRSHSHISDETLRFFRPQENHLSKYEDELEAEDDDDQFVEKSKHARKESVKKAREFTKHVLELQRETAWVHNLVANLFQRSNERLMLRADL